MNRISSYSTMNRMQVDRRDESPTGETDADEESFGDVLTDVANAGLEAVSKVAPVFPGGELVKMAADGLQKLTAETPAELGSSGSSSNFDQMWEMQRRNQVYNMQYFQLQQSAQAQNRQFKTLSNLMKVRHDTAKSAINNMRA